MQVPMGVNPHSKSWPLLLALAVAAEHEMARPENQAKGNTWAECDPQALLQRVQEELVEFDEALAIWKSAILGSEQGFAMRGAKILEEAADVVNMTMMVVDACGLLHPYQKDDREGSPSATITRLVGANSDAATFVHAFAQAFDADSRYRLERLRSEASTILTYLRRAREQAEDAGRESGAPLAPSVPHEIVEALTLARSYLVDQVATWELDRGDRASLEPVVINLEDAIAKAAAANGLAFTLEEVAAGGS